MQLFALVAFVAGVCVLQLRAALPSSAQIGLLLAAALPALIAAIAWKAKPALRRGALLAACGVLGFAYAATVSTLRMGEELAFADEGRELAVVGVVASLPARAERGVRFEFDVERVLTPGVQLPRRRLLGWYNGAFDVQPGQRWSFTVRLRRPHGAMNPGGFDLEAWMLERELRATGYVRAAPRDPPDRLDPMVWWPAYAVERARSALRERLQPGFADKRHGGVLLALILGDQRAIGDEDWTLFNRTGIAHLVSISGLHITMIAGLAGLIVSAAWRRTPALLARFAAQTAAVVAGLVAAALYPLLAGWGVPAQRTVLMLATVAAAWLAGSRIGLGTALALAAALVCLLDPWAVLAPGFWLSFGAVAAIVWVAQGRLQSGPRWKAALVTAVRVQIAVTLALVPAGVVLFHQLSVVSPLANAIAIPIVSWAVTPLALIGTGLAMLPPPIAALAEPLFMATNWLFDMLVGLLAWLASFSWATLPVASPPVLLVALAIIGAAWLLGPPGWPSRTAGLLALLPVFVWPAIRPGNGELWVTALDVGQGSALLVETRDRTWLYDAGPRYSSESDAGERVILPYLRYRGIGRLDGLIASHLDGDHSGGAASVLRSLVVERVISSITDRHPVLGQRAAVERCEAGMAWTSGALAFAVLHPDATDYERRRSTNAMSCVVAVTLGPTRLLLTGDVPAAEEAALLSREPELRASWLVAPHHGSRSSSSEALLEALGASWAVAQAGYRNRFGHPDPGIVERYRAHRVRLLRTDHGGALQWRFAADGSATVSAWRSVAARYWHNRPGPLPSPSADDDPPEGIDTNPAPPEPFFPG
jgi:competence protein ComEC